MKDHALDIAAAASGANAKVNALREYLQAYILRLVHDEGFFRSNAFLGGTALRFLHGLPRYSEDMDFSTTRKNSVDFPALLKKVKQELLSAGYDASIAYNEKRAVQSAFVKFAGLLFEAGISPMKSQKFSVKFEIDTNPPAGAVLKTELVNKFFPIAFLSYDIPSLFAGKVHALLSREYVKGRDFFDLGWYLSRWKDIRPNIALLTNALEQTHWKGPIPTEKTWRVMLRKVVEASNWKKIEDDVSAFLENPADSAIFTKQNVLGLLKK